MKKQSRRTIRFPWFPFYAQDYLASPAVNAMGAGEERAYCRMIFHASQSFGRLPNDRRKLAVLAKAGHAEFCEWLDNGALGLCWRVDGEHLVNDRLVEALEAQIQAEDRKRGAASAAGKASAAARAKRQGSAQPTAQHQAADVRQSPNGRSGQAEQTFDGLRGNGQANGRSIISEQTLEVPRTNVADAPNGVRHSPNHKDRDVEKDRERDSVVVAASLGLARAEESRAMPAATTEFQTHQAQPEPDPEAPAGTLPTGSLDASEHNLGSQVKSTHHRKPEPQPEALAAEPLPNQLPQAVADLFPRLVNVGIGDTSEAERVLHWMRGWTGYPVGVWVEALERWMARRLTETSAAKGTPVGWVRKCLKGKKDHDGDPMGPGTLLSWLQYDAAAIAGERARAAAKVEEARLAALPKEARPVQESPIARIHRQNKENYARLLAWVADEEAGRPLDAEALLKVRQYRARQELDAKRRAGVAS